MQEFPLLQAGQLNEPGRIGWHCSNKHDVCHLDKPAVQQWPPHVRSIFRMMDPPRPLKKVIATLAFGVPSTKGTVTPPQTWHCSFLWQSNYANTEQVISVHVNPVKVACYACNLYGSCVEI